MRRVHTHRLRAFLIAGLILAGLALSPLAALAQQQGGGLRQQLTALAQQHAFIIRGLDQLSQEPASAVTGDLRTQVSLLLGGYNFIVLEDGQGNIREIQILGQRSAQGNTPPAAQYNPPAPPTPAAQYDPPAPPTPAAQYNPPAQYAAYPTPAGGSCLRHQNHPPWSASSCRGGAKRSEWLSSSLIAPDRHGRHHGGLARLAEFGDGVPAGGITGWLDPDRERPGSDQAWRTRLGENR